MALRVTQVAVEALRTSTSTDLTPVSATTTISIHPATSENRDIKATP